jgi:hypothetical protein
LASVSQFGRSLCSVKVDQVSTETETKGENCGALKEEIMLAEVVAARQDLKNIIKIVLSDSLRIIVVAIAARSKNGIRHLSWLTRLM